MKKTIPIFLLLAIGGAFVAWYFSYSKVRKKAVTAQIELQLEEYNKQRIKECRTKAIERAGFLVDSLLLANAKAIQTDTNAFLLKPVKPAKPTVLTADSAGVVAPLFR